MIEVIGIKSVGGTMYRGRKMPGWNELKLSDKNTFIAPEGGFDSAIAMAEKKGYDVTRIRERVAEWVNTGKFPPHEAAAV